MIHYTCCYAPNTMEKLKGHIAFGVCACVRACVRPSVTKFIKIQFWNSYMDSSSKNNWHVFFKSALSPFVELCPFQRVILKFCNQDISKTITAMSFKLGQLIEHNEKITWWKFKKSYFIFSSYCHLQIWSLKTCHQDTCIWKSIVAWSFKHGQLVEDDE